MNGLTAPVTIEGFSGASIYDWAKKKLLEHRIPLPKSPKSDVADYEFPEDPDALTSTELGQLMLRCAAYAGRRNVQLGVLESELVALDREYKLKVGTLGLGIREELGGRPSQETVEFAVLNKHPELLPLYKRITELETIRANLKRQIETYQLHWQALSRELSRRFEEMKTGG